MRSARAEARRAQDNFGAVSRGAPVIKISHTGCSCGYPEVVQRSTWITSCVSPSFLLKIVAGRPFNCWYGAVSRGGVERSTALASSTFRSPAHILRRANARTLVTDGADLRGALLPPRLLLFSQKPHSRAPSRHKVKVLYQVTCAVRGCAMKRRTARQLVRLLSDIRHSAHCRTLRAAATIRAMELAAAEAEEEASAPESDDDARELQQDERIGRRS